VTGALGALALQKYVIILATAFAGAWSALIGALDIAGARQAASSDGWVIYPLRPPQGHEWIGIAWLVLGAIGTIVQLAARPRATKR
jgi:hypothetical protein